MARRNISRQQHGRTFQKAHNKKRAINTPTYQTRGGIRL